MRILLPIIVLGASIAIAAFLMSNRPDLARAPPEERLWVIEAVEVSYGDLQPDLTVFGEVIAGREVEMRSLVAGPVVALGENFVEGGSVRKGELLVAIDPFDSEALLDERMAQLAEARARADEIVASGQAESEALDREIEQAGMIADDAARFEVLRERGTVSQKALDDVRLALSRQREAVVVRRNAFDTWATKLAQQNAIIDRLAVGVRRAQRDLDRSRLLAPVDGFLFEISAAVGKRLSVNDRVARAGRRRGTGGPRQSVRRPVRAPARRRRASRPAGASGVDGGSAQHRRRGGHRAHRRAHRSSERRRPGLWAARGDRP